MTRARRCETCGAQPVGCCSGLDVPQLDFCAACLDMHEQECPDVRDKRAWISRWPVVHVVEFHPSDPLARAEERRA